MVLLSVMLSHSYTVTYEHRGKDRIALLLEKDHELNIRSLLKFHMTGLRLLGMCAAGKNQAAKDTCAFIPEISLQKCIDNFLDIDRKQNGMNLDYSISWRILEPETR